MSKKTMTPIAAVRKTAAGELYDINNVMTRDEYFRHLAIEHLNREGIPVTEEAIATLVDQLRWLA